MKDFRLYDISDFVMDEDFIRWVHEQREEDNLFWVNWLQQNPDKHLVIAEARLVVQSVQLQQITIEEKKVEQEVHKLLQTISAQHTSRQQSRRILTITKKYAWQMAAVLLLLCTTGALYLLTRNRPTHPFVYASITAHRNLIEKTNTTQKPLPVTLPDGSRIRLSPKSRISYSQNIDTASFRDVYLLGEAFFEVTRNVHRPFRVFANEIVTKVLGTSFTIRSFEKDTTISFRRNDLHRVDDHVTIRPFVTHRHRPRLPRLEPIRPKRNEVFLNRRRNLLVHRHRFAPIGILHRHRHVRRAVGIWRIGEPHLVPSLPGHRDLKPG